MKSGEDPTDFFVKLDEQRLHLADMGETPTDESYEGIILRALPKEYDFVRQQSHMNRNFGLTGIKLTAIDMFIDDLSRKSSASAVAGREVAMQATQGHGKKQQYKRGKDNKKRGGGASKWCSFHRTRTHSDAECKKQQELRGKPPEMANFAHIGSAHLAAAQGSPPTFGFSFAAVGPSSGEASAAAPAASTEPSAAGPSSIQLGPSQAARGQDEHVPFGTSFMVTSTPLQCTNNPLNGSSITVMVDSGSSEHFLDSFLIPGLQNRMMDYKALDEPHKIFTAGDHVLEGIGTGTVHGTVKDGHGLKTAINFSAFVVPGLGRNLFSVHTAVTKGVVTVFDSVNPRFEIGNTVIPLKSPSPPNDLYSFSMDFTSTVDAAGVALRTESAALWHRRISHINTRSMNILRKEKGDGVEYTGDLPTCEVCALGKSAQQAHPKRASYDVSRPFQLVTTDLMGPLSPPALGGFRYVSKFSDQLTKWNEVFVLKEKNSAVDTVQLYNQAVVIPSGLRLERLRADKGGENTGAAFRKYCLDVGIKLEFASTNTPQQIGANERLGRTLAGMVRCLVSDSGLPLFLWGELFLTASYLSNRAPHAALGNKTPFQALYGKPAHLGNLRAIGARAFAHIETFTKKLDARAWEGRLVGCSTDSTSFRVYHPETRKVRKSRNVVFIETPSVAPDPDLMLDEGALEYHEPDDLVRDVRNYATPLDLGSSSDNRTSDDVSVRQLLEQFRDVTDRDLRVTPARTETPETPVEQPSPPGTQSLSGGETPSAGENSPVSSQPSNPSVPNARTLRELRKLAFFAKGEFPDVGHRDGMHRFAEFAYAASNTQLHSHSPQGTVTVPESYHQAMKQPEAELWKEAAQKEI